MEKPIVALIYDFDKTLSPKDMQEYSFLPGIRVDPDKFWGLCRDFAEEHQMDGVLTYMYLMKKMAQGELDLSREKLNELGRDVAFFPGVESWFDRINRIGEASGVQVEHYIISSGLTDIIRGSAIGNQFKAVFAASFCYDAAGQPVWPSMTVNYTNKTQYLFRINKGILDIARDKELNDSMPDDSKRVPFTNMVYVGDGLSDVPCMKMMRAYGGQAVAVYQKSNRAGVEKLLQDGRVDFIFPADYREGTEFDKTVHNILRKMAVSDALSEKNAEQLRAIGQGDDPDQVMLF